MKKVQHKNIVYIAVLAIAASMLIACNKQLDEVMPHNVTDGDVMFAKPVGFQRAVEGVYSLSMSGMDAMFFIGEAQGNNLRQLVGEGTTTTYLVDMFNFIHTDKPLAASSYSKIIWDNSYSIIFNINEMLVHYKKNETNSIIRQAKAEALFLRALTYFNLVRLYGMPYYQNPETNPGVPVFTETSPTENPSRASVKATYQQIIDDLNAAIPLFNTDRGKSYGSKYTCYALLSRVYLFMGGTYSQPNEEMNQQVITNATEVIENGGYELLESDNYKNYYSQTVNSEDIYATDRNSLGSSLKNIFVQNTTGKVGFYSPSPELLNLLEDDDLRKNHYFRAPYLSAQYPLDTMATVKFGNTQATTQSKYPDRQIRLIEMYLNRAEAYAKLKTADAETKARADLNKVRTRAGLTEDNTLTGQALFDEILKQRRIELAFEGHNSFDIFRNGLTMERNYSSYMSTITQIPANSPKVVLRIPSDQINLTPGVKQNEQ